MTAAVKGAIALGIVAVVGVLIYPNITASMARSRATSRVSDAMALQDTLTSPVAKSRLNAATTTLRLALGGTEAAGTVKDADAALAAVIESIKSAPPPDHPVTGDLMFADAAHAGQTFPINVNVRTELAEAYLVRIIAQVDVDGGWKSGPITQVVDQPLKTPTAMLVRVDVAVPKDASGNASVQATIVYRLGATGEGREYQELVRGKTRLAIGK